MAKWSSVTQNSFTRYGNIHYVNGVTMSNVQSDDTAFTHELSIMDFKLLEDSTATPLVQNNGQPDGLRVAKADPAGRVCPFAAHIR